MSVNAPNNELGWKAPDFNLLSVDDRSYSLKQLHGPKGTVIAFICNHCPYVTGIIDRLVSEAEQLNNIGVSLIAIMSNDVNVYPEDSFDNMKLFAKKYDFNFHYLYDSSQQTAKDYKAVCTPDIFGFNSNLKLKYRGRLDSGIMINDNNNINRDLFYAMEFIAKTNEGPIEQFNSLGCSIKWINND